MIVARAGLVATVLAVVGGCERAAPHGAADTAASTMSDSATVVRVALDTLARAGARDYVADSLVRHGDTVVVWTGPRVWMATDRPMSAVSVVSPSRVVAVRHIMGG